MGAEDEPYASFAASVVKSLESGRPSAREKVSTVRDIRVEGSEETTCLSPVMGKYSLSFLPEKMISSALSTLGRT